jgi:hypothetical protein
MKHFILFFLSLFCLQAPGQKIFKGLTIGGFYRPVVELRKGNPLNYSVSQGFTSISYQVEDENLVIFNPMNFELGLTYAFNEASPWFVGVVYGFNQNDYKLEYESAAGLNPQETTFAETCHELGLAFGLAHSRSGKTSYGWGVTTVESGSKKKHFELRSPGISLGYAFFNTEFGPQFKENLKPYQAVYVGIFSDYGIFNRFTLGYEMRGYFYGKFEATDRISFPEGNFYENALQFFLRIGYNLKVAG